MDKAASIVDVARHAGVSVSTVSLVMNNRPNVAADTARAVWCSVKALGYRPGGATGRKRGPKPGPRRLLRIPRLLLLETGYPVAYFRSDLVSGLLHGVQSAVSPGTVELILCHAPERAAPDVLRRSRTDGVLVTGQVTDPRLREALSRVPCVQALGGVPADLLWDQVAHDALAAARCAGRWFAQRNHPHCLAVVSDGTSPDQTRLALQQEIRDGGSIRLVDGRELLRYEGIFPEADCGRLAALFAAVQAAPPVPTGVFLDTDVLAAPFYGLCREHGMEPGRDLVLVCASLRGPSIGSLRPSPAVVDLHPEQVGRQAVEQLLWRIAHRNEPRVLRLIAPTLA